MIDRFKEDIDSNLYLINSYTKRIETEGNKKNIFGQIMGIYNLTTVACRQIKS